MQKDFYSEYYQVEDQHWWFVGRRNIFLQMLDLHAPKSEPKNRRILDVGCGTGTMLKYLSRYGEAFGVDADEEAVRFCRLRNISNVSQLVNNNLPFEDDSFDILTMFDVLEHIDDDKHAVREALRILKPGGMFMLSVPAYRFLWGPQDVISFHKRRYLASEIDRLLRACHFQVRKLSYFNTFLFPIIAGIRVMRPLLGKSDEQPKSDFGMSKPGITNNLLSRIFSAESFLLPKLSLPFGVSILAIAFKPVSAGTNSPATESAASAASKR